jgi:hypothetical protein
LFAYLVNIRSFREMDQKSQDYRAKAEECSQVVPKPEETLKAMVVGLRQRHGRSMLAAASVFRDMAERVVLDPDGAAELLECMLPMLLAGQCEHPLRYAHLLQEVSTASGLPMWRDERGLGGCVFAGLEADLPEGHDWAPEMREVCPIMSEVRAD